MDESNYNNLINICPDAHLSKVKMILNEVQPGENLSVPDPYYGDDGFQLVFDLLDEACEVVAKKIKNNE